LQITERHPQLAVHQSSTWLIDEDFYLPSIHPPAVGGAQDPIHRNTCNPATKKEKMMRRVVVFLGLVVFSFASVSPLNAGGIFNKQNMSADYLRSLTRNASTDAADIVAYNPAGVMKLDSGLYTKLDAMYFDKQYRNTVPDVYAFEGEDGTYETDEPTIVPSFFTVYKRGRWAGYFAITIPGGGGKGEYPDGNARTVQLAANIIDASGGTLVGIDHMFLEGDSIQTGFTLGGALDISKMVSIAGGVRYVDATQSLAGVAGLRTALSTVTRFEIDLEREAAGWSYFLGVNVAPVKKLNVGFLYMSNTKLDWETDVIKDDVGVTPALGWDEKQRNDLPGVLGLGLAYRIIDPLLFEINYTRYLETRAALDERRFESPGDSFDLAMSFTYTFHPQWRASVGYMRTDIRGMENESLRPETPELDANSIAAGIVYGPIDRFEISLGYTDVNYDSVTTDTPSSGAPAGTELAKEVWAVSLGLQYRFF
jgi:long-chain fatty acid transport protein